MRGFFTGIPLMLFASTAVFLNAAVAFGQEGGMAEDSSTKDSLNKDSLNVELDPLELYEKDYRSDETSPGGTRFDPSMTSSGIGKDAADFLVRLPGIEAYSQGNYGGAWYAAPSGLDSRYLGVWFQGRPLSDIRKGRYDLSLLHDYNLLDGGFVSSYSFRSAPGEGAGVVRYRAKPAFTDRTESQVVYKRGRGNFGDVNVLLRQRMNERTSVSLQGLVRNQEARETLTGYKGRKILGIFARRLTSGWNATATSSHIYRTVKIHEPFAGYFGHEIDGRMRDVTFDHTFELTSPERKTALSTYLSSRESRRVDNSLSFEDNGFSYYYGLQAVKELNLHGAGRLQAGIRTEFHSVRGIGYRRKQVNESRVFLGERLGEFGGSRLELTAGVANRSDIGAELTASASGNLMLSEFTGLYAAYARNVVFPPLDYLWMQTGGATGSVFSGDSTLGAERLNKLGLGLLRQKGDAVFRVGFESTNVQNPVTIDFSGELKPTVGADYTVPAVTGEWLTDPGGRVMLGANVWYNLDYEPERAFSKQYSSFSFLRVKGSLFESNMKVTMQWENVLLGEGNRLTYDPLLDFHINVGGASLPRKALFNLWLTADIGSLAILYRIDNLFRTPYELLDGYELTGMDTFFGVRWDFID